MKAHVIMLISRDPVVTRAVQDAVLAARHGLRLIADHARALHELGTNSDDVDLAILDLDPGIHGLKLFTTARERMPVLVITHHDATDMQRILHRHGALGCLTKPFTADQLRTAIRELIEPRAMAA